MTGTFTFLGETKNFRGFDIIDKVTTADPYKTITARHIATKLWTFFAYPNPDATLIADLVTSTNFANTWNIKDLLRGILVHNSFYSTNAKTGLVSNPAEYSARLLSIFGQRAGGAVVELNKTTIYFDHDTVNAMVDMSQELLNPPNVAGWKNNSYWLSTSQLGARGNLAKRLWGYSVMINKMKDLESLSVDSAVVTAARRLGIVNLQPATKSNIVTWLTVQRARSGSSADFRSQGLLHLLIMSPDFQLS